MAKVALGVPFYQTVPPEWWVQLVEHAALIGKQHDFKGILAVGAMTADASRNIIVNDFLKTDAEWLLWIDSDTVVPIGALDRMLAVGKTLVSGVYYAKNEPHMPIAYYFYNGAFAPIDKLSRWEKGEILPIDAAGMGCMLTHRSVYEDILANFSLFQSSNAGGLYPIHNNSIIGEVKADEKHEHDGKVYRGQLRTRLVPVTMSNVQFPFFQIEHNRTEDIFFFNLTRQVGHKPWLDTSVECAHLTYKGYTGEDYRNEKGH